MQENATREDLLREIEALKQENADLNTQIKALRRDQALSLENISKERLRAQGLALEVENLTALNKVYQQFIDEQTKLPKSIGLCQCGCGEKIIQPESGRRKKFYSDACRKRYARRSQKLKEAKKIFTRKKQRPKTS